MKPSHHNRCSSYSDVGWRFPSLIAKVIVDYDSIGNVIDYDDISFFVSSIDYDYSKNCNRLRLMITITHVWLKCLHSWWIQFSAFPNSMLESLLYRFCWEHGLSQSDEIMFPGDSFTYEVTNMDHAAGWIIMSPTLFYTWLHAESWSSAQIHFLWYCRLSGREACQLEASKHRKCPSPSIFPYNDEPNHEKRGNWKKAQSRTATEAGLPMGKHLTNTSVWWAFPMCKPCVQ